MLQYCLLGRPLRDKGVLALREHTHRVSREHGQWTGVRQNLKATSLQYTGGRGVQRKNTYEGDVSLDQDC